MNPICFSILKNKKPAIKFGSQSLIQNKLAIKVNGLGVERVNDHIQKEGEVSATDITHWCNFNPQKFV